MHQPSKELTPSQPFVGPERHELKWLLEHAAVLDYADATDQRMAPIQQAGSQWLYACMKNYEWHSKVGAIKQQEQWEQWINKQEKSNHKEKKIRTQPKPTNKTPQPKKTDLTSTRAKTEVSTMYEESFKKNTLDEYSSIKRKLFVNDYS